MSALTLRPATPDDMEDIARLCWAYRAMLADRSRSVPGFVETYYSADTYAAMIADLPRVHARPKGDIVLARLKDATVGCAMYYPISATTCEIKRVFVDPAARGTGAGRALMVVGMEHAARDGYGRMVLDTIATLTEAIGLYERMGFRPCEPFYDPDPKFAPVLRFFDHPL